VGVDFDDAVTLQATFTGSDKAFMSTGTSDRQVRDEIALINAAIRADVPYFLGAILAHIRITDLKGTAPAIPILALGITTLVVAIARW
jgi:NAD(P)H dehydrogenase (quinone)